MTKNVTQVLELVNTLTDEELHDLAEEIETLALARERAAHLCACCGAQKESGVRFCDDCNEYVAEFS